MLTITIPARPDSVAFNEETSEFVTVPGLKKDVILQMEHSLVSLSKWESKWHKPFLTKEDKSFEETLDYIKCMTLTKNVDPNVYTFLTRENIDAINAYISDPMTATTFRKTVEKKSNEIITSEVVYYWMISLQIPPEYDKWHLNRLLTLIRVCNIKNQPPKKRSSSELMSNYSALNKARREALNSKG